MSGNTVNPYQAMLTQNHVLLLLRPLLLRPLLLRLAASDVLVHEKVWCVIEHAMLLDHHDLSIIHQQPCPVGLPHMRSVVTTCSTHTASTCSTEFAPISTCTV